MLAALSAAEKSVNIRYFGEQYSAPLALWRAETAETITSAENIRKKRQKWENQRQWLKYWVKNKVKFWVGVSNKGNLRFIRSAFANKQFTLVGRITSNLPFWNNIIWV